MTWGVLGPQNSMRGDLSLINNIYEYGLTYISVWVDKFF